MATRVVVHVHEARDLPVMNYSSQLTDAYVEVRFKEFAEKTPVARKTLNPVWNEKLGLTIDNKSIQDEVLLINVWDHDRFGQDNVIGQVSIDLLPLVPFNGTKISGWFPIYDTLKGIRGSIALTVKLKIIRDQNKYRDTSVGVTFFSSPTVPETYTIVAVRGFVEELIVKDDPEYQWIDRMRPTRQSNQARQAVFANLTGELQRKVGLKAIDLHANAVVGYRQLFDLEGESGLVARGIGTAVLVMDPARTSEFAVATMLKNRALFSDQLSYSFAKAENQPMSIGQTRIGFDGQIPVALITLGKLPDGLVTSIGGIVTARAVKLLNKMENPEETDTRDGWWEELRNEIAGHARSLGYSAVIGYAEATSISDNLCLLSATGTAAVLNTDPMAGVAFIQPDTAAHRGRRTSQLESTSIVPTPTAESELSKQPSHIADFDHEFEADPAPCHKFHLPEGFSVDTYASFSTPCLLCGGSADTVPEVLFTTVSPPDDIPLVGTAVTVQARVCRLRKKKASNGYDHAKSLGESMPFIEYSLHQQLYNKLRVLAMNALFNLKIEVTIGSHLVCVVATATAVHLACLPTPRKLQFLRSGGLGKGAEEMRRISFLTERADRNHESMDAAKAQFLEGYDPGEGDDTTLLDTSSDDFQQQSSIIGRPADAPKKAIVIEIDDAVDQDELASLFDIEFPQGCFYSNTETLPGLDTEHCYEEDFILDVITVVDETEINPSLPVNQQFANIFNKILLSLRFKLRKKDPCLIASARWSVALPEEYEVQVVLTATIIKLRRKRRHRQLSTSSLNSGPRESTDLAEEAVEASGRVCLLPKPDYKRLSDLPQVWMTSNSSVPNQRIALHLGPVIVYAIKETISLRDAGGVGNFVHLFIQEVLALIKAQVRARGGNALVSYRVRDLDVIDNSHKNQAQCLIAVQGDAALCYEESELDASTFSLASHDDDDDDDDGQGSTPATPGSEVKQRGKRHTYSTADDIDDDADDKSSATPSSESKTPTIAATQHPSQHRLPPRSPLSRFSEKRQAANQEQPSHSSKGVSTVAETANREVDFTAVVVENGDDKDDDKDDEDQYITLI